MKKGIMFFAITLLVVIQSYSVIIGKLEAKEIDFHNFPKTNDTQTEYTRSNSATTMSAYNNKNSITQKVTSQQSSVQVSNSKLDSIAQRALNAAENHNQSELNKCAKEFMIAGVDRIYPPSVVSKKTPQCPPIKMELNGRTMQGSKCVKMGYMYNGKTYWTGYCKP